jgi:hypothetical protein
MTRERWEKLVDVILFVMVLIQLVFALAYLKLNRGLAVTNQELSRIELELQR